MRRILVPLRPSLEVLFALWLIRTFGISGQKGFRNAKLVLNGCAGEIPVIHRPEDILVLRPGCLDTKMFRRQFNVPAEYKGVVDRIRSSIRSGPWVRGYEEEMRASRLSISQLTKIVFGTFQSQLPNRPDETDELVTTMIRGRQSKPPPLKKRQFPLKKQERKR